MAKERSEFTLEPGFYWVWASDLGAPEKGPRWEIAEVRPHHDVWTLDMARLQIHRWGRRIEPPKTQPANLSH